MKNHAPVCAGGPFRELITILISRSSAIVYEYKMQSKKRSEISSAALLQIQE